MKAFAQAERFVSELESRKLRAAYVFVGDEAFFRKRFRDAILEHLVPADLRDFSFFEFDLAENDLAEVLDRARTPSLMAPFQVFFVRGVKNFFGRGSNEEKLAAIEEYCKNPNPDALVVFVADHISIPADVRRMEMQDKERYQRIRETMGQYCGIVELARVEEGEAVRWISEYCAGREREDRSRWRPRTGRRARRRHDDDLQRTGEADSVCRRKKAHHAGRRRNHGAGRQAAVFVRTDRRNLTKERVRALEVLDAMLLSGDGEEAAIGHIYMLAKTFRQMLVILERNVRDQRMLWAALWQGFRVPPFAADDIIKQARRYKSGANSRARSAWWRRPTWLCARIP